MKTTIITTTHRAQIHHFSITFLGTTISSFSLRLANEFTDMTTWQAQQATIGTEGAT
jgi:hypothetical protein